MRLLSAYELDLVAGGLNPSDEVTITGDPNPDPDPWDYPPDPPENDNDPGYGGGGGGGGGGSSQSTYPANFDHQMDYNIDQLGKSIAAQIKNLPNADKHEYAAIIWRDVNGVVHSTTIKEGTTNTVDTSSLMSQISQGGIIVGLVHSHPILYNAGSDIYPNWQPVNPELTNTLSSGDFDKLIDYSNGATGYDSTNFRSYLAFDGGAKEYYAADQDTSMYGAGSQATWAVESSDYATHVN